MKSILTITLLVLLSFGCTKNDNPTPQEAYTIMGRWHLVGFEQTVMYQFTDSLRYTLYSTDGNFGPLDTAIPNPNEWRYDGDSIVIDLHFGNYYRAIPTFKCSGQVVTLESASNTTILFKEGYDYSTCDE